ncbi:MAG: hypothetical protein JWO77_1040 [Ilumatobacteraceae bacterium]|nr:hypothetical protein [Ilumatobacteraceae bacterium]
MITLRSLPSGAMGPAPHRSHHRHDVDQPVRRVRPAIARTARRGVALITARRTRPLAIGADAAGATLAD